MQILLAYCLDLFIPVYSVANTIEPKRDLLQASMRWTAHRELNHAWLKVEESNVVKLLNWNAPQVITQKIGLLNYAHYLWFHVE